MCLLWSSGGPCLHLNPRTRVGERGGGSSAERGAEGWLPLRAELLLLVKRELFLGKKACKLAVNTRLVARRGRGFFFWHASTYLLDITTSTLARKLIRLTTSDPAAQTPPCLSHEPKSNRNARVQRRPCIFHAALISL